MKSLDFCLLKLARLVCGPDNEKGFVDLLLDLRIVTETQVAMAMAEHCETTFVDLDTTEIAANVIALMSGYVAHDCWAVPVRMERGNVLIAISDQAHTEKLFRLNLPGIPRNKIQIVIATENALGRALARYYPTAPFGSAAGYKVEPVTVRTTGSPSKPPITVRLGP